MLDLLGTALAPLRITGATLLHEAYAPPWAVSVPSSAELAAALGLGAHCQAIAFHLVRAGAFTLQVGSRARRVESGELAVVFSGAPHLLADGKGAVPRPVAQLIAAPRPPRARAPEGATRLVCGVFVVEDAQLHPLFASLPSVLSARTDSQGDSLLSSPVAELLVRELDRPGPGGSYAVARLVELLCLEVLRAHAATGDPPPSFLRGLSDSTVSRAIRKILAQPGAPLTVPALARAAGLSPSRFAARFRQAVGMGPMEFATRWRVDLAGRWLSRTDWNVSEIAYRVGYESPAAFSRAFSRVAGQAPHAWRQARRAPPAETRLIAPSHARRRRRGATGSDAGAALPRLRGERR